METCDCSIIGTDVNTPTLVHHLFEQAAERHGLQVALKFKETQLTYQQLQDRANGLCQTILRVAPAAPIIGISTARGLEMVVGILAILKAGKAYLPLNPTYPTARLHQIIASSGLTTCLCHTHEQDVFADLGLHCIPSEQPHAYSSYTVAAQNQVAYVLYTSGSTGEPKGVCMGHSALLNLLHWQNRNSLATTATRTLQLAALTFDVSFQEIFATLTTGGTLVLIDDDLRIDFTGLLGFLATESINRLFLPFVALQYLAEAAIDEQLFPASLQEVMTAGEQLKITTHVRSFFAALPGCVLFNQYGPTECHVVTQLKLDGDAASWPPLPTIGQPIDNTFIVVVDSELQLVPTGDSGELCIGGVCLAEGYLNQPVLTATKFIDWTTPTGTPARLYRTGDIARFLPDGSIEFQGRQDDQVKIRGHRVELGEVEVLLNTLGTIKQAVVVARAYDEGEKKLLAYLVSKTSTQDTAAVRKAIEQGLPDYMMPSAFVWMEELPLTSSGKVDKKALPVPGLIRPELAVLYRKPASELEKILTTLWAELLHLDRVGADDNFFELGGNSLLAQKTVGLLKLRHQLLVPITKLYLHPTAAGVARLLTPPTAVAAPAAPVVPEPQNPAGTDIAIIGLAGRFPGADTIDELWQVLKEGRETTRFFTHDELDASISPALKNDPLYVKARGVINHADQFDAAFFGLNPKLTELMDPQQRVFLEIAWEALEQAGYLPQQYSGRVGVFAGTGNNTYYHHNVLSNRQLVEQVGSFQVMTANEKDYIASRTAYQLNLKGPAVSVYSACSTSLLAVAQAVQSLRSGQCAVALAGGASITSPMRSGHLYEEGAMLSRDGHCRVFDAAAQGTVFSDGAGVVLLKNLAAAQQDGDTIFAVIKGVGINNDGSNKGSFTAPSAEGQAAAIQMALQDARVAPSGISYVEAHGTGTPIGDPIEIEGLTLAFGEQVARQTCALGSIKSNMGHLTTASGVAGLIKATLALHHKQLPASLGFETPNPHIDFAATPFFVNTRLREWRPLGLRRAGVSSFGVGGTNVHVVLEEATQQPASSTDGRPAQLVTWSAKTVTSREAYAQKLSASLHAPNQACLADVAYTLQKTRASFAHRRFAVAATSEELAQALSTPTPTATSTVRILPGEVVFLFPGQGSQYLNMGRELYETESVYRQAIDTCAELLQSELEADIRTILYAESSSPTAAETLKNTRYTQPALFVTEYAMAKLWMSWGIQPSVFCGHSIGEFVAAHLAGVFTLPDALRLIAQRGRLVSELPRGSMLSVRLPAEQVEALLPAALSMAAINSTKLCVVAGEDEPIASFARLLDERGIANRVLATSHAFHSAMMTPVVATFQAMVAQVALSRPQKPIVSTVSGTWLTDAQATDAHYWANHLQLTVRFADALNTVFQQDNPLLLEVGPGNVAATLARQQATQTGPILPGLKPSHGSQTELRAVLDVLGQLWLSGLEPDWQAFYAGQNRRTVSLPSYAFDRKPCWVEPPVAVAAPPAVPVPAVAAPALTIQQPIPELPAPVMRKDTLLNKVKSILENASGIEMDGVTPEMSLLEIGLDSLLITQVAITLKREFNLPITFRQLNEEYATLEALTTYLDSKLPAEAYQPAAPQQASAPAPTAVVAAAAAPVAPSVAYAPSFAPPVANGGTMLGIVAQQLQLLSQQVMLLQGGTTALPAPVATPATAAVATVAEPAVAKTSDLTTEEEAELKKPFGAAARIERQATDLNEKQQEFLRQLTIRYNQKTRGSKAYTQQHRAHMADPRVVSGFKPLTKEIVYPLIVNRSKGSRLWDIDGNEYIDALNGFGSSMLGHQPDSVTTALHQQIENGYEVGPQHELAGEVSQLICEFTNFDRAALCNTGSEAVLGALRVARTVTGRSLVVAFSGSYHGIIDEVLVRGTKKLKTFPAAPGIMPEAVQNMLILDYGTEESRRIIAERAHELAAILVEPVQSRRPEFTPIDFLKQVRTITAASGTCLIFDEVITGFRMHPGGAQALFDIKADLACYGKVVGGGISIGAIAGKKEFMDALDGGFWQYGDASYPEVGVTYFAGTFVRHPLALAAAKASLLYMKAKGPALQKSINNKTDHLANALNTEFKQQQLPFFVAHFGSLWKIKFKEELPYSELLFTLMREKGIHIWDGFPCFMTEAHSLAEIESIISACLESVKEMVEVGLFPSSNKLIILDTKKIIIPSNTPPIPGARLGRDEDGNPAWFITNPESPDKYLKIDTTQLLNNVFQ